jgi:lipoprotein-releasing system permease protein
LRFASELFETGSKVSAIELKLLPGTDLYKIQRTIQNIVGADLLVKNKYQQHDTLFKTMKSEKWATYFILVFVILIASFNILGSLSMLILDKREDISVLQSMGANNSLIKRIFIIEGWLISLAGSLAGLIAGVSLCLIQIWFGLIRLPGSGSFVISAYPVEIQIADLFLIFFIVAGIGFLAVQYPVRHISGKYFSEYS